MKPICEVCGKKLENEYFEGHQIICRDCGEKMLEVSEDGSLYRLKYNYIDQDKEVFIYVREKDEV